MLRSLGYTALGLDPSSGVDTPARMPPLSLAVDDTERVTEQDADKRPNWTVRQVRGRGSSPEKGLATVHSMTLQSADGADFVIDRLDLSRHPLVEAVPIAVARPRTFDRCPICLDQNPVSREHVPPKSIGGDVMTHTCRRCNNRAGSVLERALLDWWEDALVSVRLSHEEVSGARRVPRILLRQTRGGEPVFFCDDGLFDPAIAGKFLRAIVSR